ncbi:MAG: 3-hydroxyacyl-CoA dehydrogenase/enoyl-CoA hydratase family protein [Candidatus Marinimicrobia bacterium]|nr:3-hydroxyacyl-CoA dehydrogenase/enoyl-CoA hydratase family protein [Candidatus Neomarinimicrobiota bacterium]
MKRIKSVGIIGAGTMGSALAQKFAQEGFPVTIMDREDRFLQKGLSNIQSTLNEGVERRIFTPEKVEAILGRITLTTTMSDLSTCGLIIEAVFEDLAVKQDLFARLSESVPVDTIIATNTSSFSVTELSSFVSHPERFLGLHFFYHAAKNRLVEIVKGEKTNDEAFEQCMWFMQQCGKDPIVCEDANGFVVNRFFVPWLNEAVRIFEEGIAQSGDIDLIACKTFGCGMGPFALMNATGVPIAYHAQKTLQHAFGDFYKPADALKAQTDLNLQWEIPETTDLDSKIAETISERLASVVLFVCGQILDEKICTAGDISRGAGVGLQWRKTPIDLFFKYGESRVKSLTEKLSHNWKMPVPLSITQGEWIPDFVSSEIKGDVGRIIINRPEGLNAMNPLVVSQLAVAFDQLDADPDITTIILTGRGKAFVAGADIKFFIDHIKNQTIPEIVKFTTEGQALFQRIDVSTKKIVAVVNGLALGGGLELALTADVIVALNNAVFAFPETGIGIYPGLGGTQRTIDRVGTGLTKFMIYTGQMLNAKTATEIGLIDGIVTWNEIQSLPEHASKLSRKNPILSDYWQEISNYFNSKTVYNLLDNHYEIPTGMEKMISRIRTKAPIALQLSERLINDHKGPESELMYISDLFRTQDALAGLQNVGKKPPTYRGI